MKKSMIVLAVSLLLVPAFAETSKVTSLDAAVRNAIKEHPALSAIRQSQEARKNEIDIARGSLFPSIDVRAASGQEESENSTVVNAGDQHLALTRLDTSLVVRQQLYTGGRIKHSIARSRHLASEVFYGYLDEKERTVFNAIDAYLAYNRNKELLLLSNENVRIHEEILSIVSKRKKNKMASSADVIQVKGRLALAKAQLRRELANRDSVRAQFVEAIVAEPASNVGRPVEHNQNLPKNLVSAKNIAVTTHPALSARAKNIEAAKSSVAEAASAFYPQVALELRFQENDNTAGTESNSDSASALIIVDWNLFRGGSDKATTRARLSQVSQGEDQLLDEKRKIVRNTAVAWHTYRGTLVELNYFKQHEKASKETLKAYKGQYKLAKRTLFDLLNSQNELFLASSRVIETDYAKIRAVYNIFANMGNISSLFDKK